MCMYYVDRICMCVIHLYVCMYVCMYYVVRIRTCVCMCVYMTKMHEKSRTASSM